MADLFSVSGAIGIGWAPGAREPWHQGYKSFNAASPRNALSRLPEIHYRDDGSIWGEGLLFHMEGLWQLRVGVMANGLMERVVFDVDMEP